MIDRIHKKNLYDMHKHVCVCTCVCVCTQSHTHTHGKKGPLQVPFNHMLTSRNPGKKEKNMSIQKYI